MENTINQTDLVEQTNPEVGQTETPETSENSPETQSEEQAPHPSSEEHKESDGFLKIPSGAIADIKRKAREAGRQEAALQIQREYEALQRQQEFNSGASSQEKSQQQPASYYNSQDQQALSQEANLVEERGTEKYRGTEFDPRLNVVLGSFDHVVLNQIKNDQYARQVAAEILKSDFPIGKEDVLYKVFSDKDFLEDLRYMNPQGVRMKVQKYIWNANQKPKPVSRPANPPLSQIKTSANTQQNNKKLSIREKLAILEGRSKR